MNTNLSISSWNVDGLGDKCKDDLFLSCMKYANINTHDFKILQNAGKNREGQNGSAVVLLYYTNQNYIKEYRYELQDMSTSKNRIWLKGILSTSCVIFPYTKLLSISVLTFIK